MESKREEVEEQLRKESDRRKKNTAKKGSALSVSLGALLYGIGRIIHSGLGVESVGATLIGFIFVYVTVYLHEKDVPGEDKIRAIIIDVLD